MSKQKNKKPKVAIISLTSCDGCQVALLDLGQRFLELFKKIDLSRFNLLKDEKFDGHYDLSFVEGNPTTEEQIKILKRIRQNSNFLVVLGNCAAMGGIQEIKNYHQPQKVIRAVYKNPSKISNLEIKEVKDFVPVDYTLPTCPLNAEEFLQLVYDFLNEKKFKIPERPVCYECQINEHECLLQKGQICFGPWILGGCQAICLKSGQPCWGCRGLLSAKGGSAAGGKEVDKKKLIETLKQVATEAEILKQAEIFGLRDEIEE